MELDNIIAIFEKENRLLTLNEIYSLYAQNFDTQQYKDYKSAIRSCINRNSLDRENNTSGNNIFYPLLRKQEKGQKYGLIRWKNESLKSYLDKDLKSDINDSAELEKEFIISEAYSKNTIQRLKRNIPLKIEAIEKANFLCEYNASHLSFKRKSNGENYTEAHHLIPLAAQSLPQFQNVNLDVLENIVSLCSNCHNQLHYGENPEEILRVLYNEKINGLKKVGLNISFNDLLKFYR